MNKNITTRLDELMNTQIEKNLIIGGALRVIKNGKCVYDNQFGYAEIANNKPIKGDTIYRMYSMSKPVTAVALMILYDREEIDLHDKVWWYLEGFKNQTVITEDGEVPVKRDMEILDLLNMTSGLMYPDRVNEAGNKMADLFDTYYASCFAGNQCDYSTVKMCNLIGQQPLCYQPGEKWNYGTSADVLGGIIEVVSKKRFGDFLKDEIFTPLGMVDTDFYVSKDKYSRLAEIYLRNESGALVPVEWQHLGLFNHYKTRPAFEIGGCGLVSTMEDYSRFATMLLSGGKWVDNQIISQNAIDFLTQNHLTDQQAKTFDWEALQGYSYGGLMRVLTDPIQSVVGSVGEYGWDGWTGNYFLNDPKTNTTVLYMIQTAGGNGPRPIRMLKQVVYSEE